LEEDTGKTTHAGSSSLIDYNRAGSPLVEMVFEPDLRAPAEAKAAVEELRLLARTLGVSDADMEKGHLRCDANVSVRPAGSTELGAKVEVKNLNSLRSIQRALEHEVQRQTKLWEAGAAPRESETRGWDERQQITVSQRSKEGRHDYRYFPEPDLPPLVVSEQELEVLRKDLPVLPQQRRQLLQSEYSLAPAAASLLVSRGLDSYFDQVLVEGREWVTSTLEEGTTEEKWQQWGPKFTKATVNWMDELQKHIEATPGSRQPTPENFAEFLTYILERKVNSTAAQTLLRRMVETGGDPAQILADGDLSQVSDATSIASIVDQIIAENPDAIADLKAGKQNAMKFLVGAAMKASKGKADPEAVQELLVERLGAI
jgi:aspartyl-tRNA(Asn)/glutamyl-tRNA(Gln) amidotransferase subunit B